MILFLIILFWAVGVILFSVYKIAFRGKDEYLILFVILYLPFYTTILSIVYLYTRSELIVNVFQYAKELIVLLAILAFIFYKKDFLGYGFRLLFIDYVFLAFLALGVVFVFLPLGTATLVGKATYFKNILLLGLLYFLGRNMVLKELNIKAIASLIFFIGILAFIVNIFEYLTYTHLQTYTGATLFSEDIAGTEMSGSYGLAWTFETSSGQKRFGAFFTSPLELASSVLLTFSTAVILYINSIKVEKWKYFFIACCALFSLLFTVSRAPFVGLFLQIFFIALLFKLYRLITVGLLLGALAFLYFILFASPDMKLFVYETISFQNPSSLGHLIEWFDGIESMINFPLGIGLAMSGNAGGVDDSIKVGGENQFIIFGVQFGILGLVLYCTLIILSISYSIKAYKSARDAEEKVIPFIAASVKFGMLLPLVTSNAELFLYISLLSWWMVGYSVSLYSRNKVLLREGLPK